MCGITGLFTKKNTGKVVENLELMTQALAHRGPDDEGYTLVGYRGTDVFTEDFAGTQTSADSVKQLKGNFLTQAHHTQWAAGLGHRRLSIFDVSSAGHQPMVRGNYSLVFNGAIYNYEELRAELQAEGHVFYSNTDTEVLLVGYMAWGERVLTKLDGMFSFAILDLKEKKVFAARDILGVKPFYYIDTPEGFAFASEQKALQTLPFCPKRISRTAVFQYLVQGNLEERKTGLIKYIEELLPGYCLEYYLDTDNAKASAWYNLSGNEKFENFKAGNYKRYKDKITGLLFASIEARLKADVTMGACLSGGLDSTSLVSIASGLLANGRHSLDSLPVFTACFPSTIADESTLAKATADKLGLTWHGTYPEAPDLATDLIDLVRTHDVPLQTPSTYAQYRVMQLAAQQGVKVTLDGQGADELFGGYALHYQAFFLEMLEKRDYMGCLTELLYANNNFANRAQTLKTLSKKIQGKIVSDKRIEAFYKTRHPEYQLLRSTLWESQKHRLNAELAGVSAGLNAIIQQDLHGSTLRGHLRIADRNSMRFGIETRLPFADSKELLEYVQNIAGVYKIRNQQNKSLLRSAVSKYVPPEILREKNKIGFEGPNRAWIKALSPMLKEAVLAPGMEDYVHNRTFYKNWDGLLEDSLRRDPHRIFRFGALGLWFKHVYNR